MEQNIRMEVEGIIYARISLTSVYGVHRCIFLDVSSIEGGGTFCFCLNFAILPRSIIFRAPIKVKTPNFSSQMDVNQFKKPYPYREMSRSPLLSFHLISKCYLIKDRKETQLYDGRDIIL
jgi:hypothetical protein